MSEEEQRNEEQPESAPPEGGEGEAGAAPAPSEPAEETPPATDAAASAPADESSEEGPDEAAEGDAGEAGGSDEPVADVAPKAKAADVAPGADLEPIALEPERQLTAEERARAEAEAEERAQREAEATGEAREEEPTGGGRATVSIPGEARIQATGKRKRAVARVLLRAGSGQIEINDRSLDEYFPRDHHRTIARQPLVAAGYDGSVDLRIRVHGGGVGGQAGAVRHGIARALCEVDPGLRGELKRRGMLTRDARQKERRKAGLKKARKRPQFSKR